MATKPVKGPEGTPGVATKPAKGPVRVPAKEPVRLIKPSATGEYERVMG